jgi:uncharacterized protein YbaR (Trm112 family)
LGIDKKLLEILACPSCKGDIKEVEGGNGLKCVECGLVYPVRDGIPIMLIDEAKKDKPE